MVQVSAVLPRPALTHTNSQLIIKLFIKLLAAVLQQQAQACLAHPRPAAGPQQPPAAA